MSSVRYINQTNVPTLCHWPLANRGWSWADLLSIPLCDAAAVAAVLQICCMQGSTAAAASSAWLAASYWFKKIDEQGQSCPLQSQTKMHYWDKSQHFWMIWCLLFNLRTRFTGGHRNDFHSHTCLSRNDTSQLNNHFIRHNICRRERCLSYFSWNRCLKKCFYV